VFGSWFLVLGSWFLVLGSWFLVLGSWFLVQPLFLVVICNVVSGVPSHFSMLAKSVRPNI